MLSLPNLARFVQHTALKPLTLSNAQRCAPTLAPLDDAWRPIAFTVTGCFLTMLLGLTPLPEASRCSPLP